jgi:enoyl-CoA hydratase
MSLTDPVRYERDGGVATIWMDDGKANVMSATMLDAISDALQRADDEAAVVLLAGRPKMFSGGYDLAMFTRGADEIVSTLRKGAELVHRLLSFPYPVVAACTGHAIAQGAFTLLATDVRIGAHGSFRIGLNEVVIGLTIPHYGVEAARMRLSPPWFNHSTLTGTFYTPAEAVNAGFLDELADVEHVVARAREEADKLTAIDMKAHAGTKLRVRAPALAAIRAGIDSEFPTR